MTLKNRLTWRFLQWLFLLLILIILLYPVVVLFFFGINTSGTDDPYIGNVLRKIKKETHIKGGEVNLTLEGEQELDKIGAWLQILNGEGQQVYSYRLPAGLPHHYTPGELSDEKRQQPRLHSWYGSIEGKKYTWVLGFWEDSLLRRTLDSADIQGNSITLPTTILTEIKESKGWLQVLNESGKEIFSYRRPSSHPHHLSAGELSALLTERRKNGYEIRYWLDLKENRNWTWILVKPNPQIHEIASFQDRLNLMMGTYLLILLLITSGIALLFGRRLGAPLLHMMKWLRYLADGKFQEPTDKKGTPVSQSPVDKKLRRPFRIYREVIDALNTLTHTLKKNEKERLRLEQSREEWITGVSHDLKTPLSSIKGYADMLAYERYEWSPEEVKQFASTIQEKAAYMEQLIEDLSLTFRLKNDALPLQIQPANIIEIIRHAAIDVVNNPQWQDRHIELDVPEQAVYYPLDPAWFKRAIDNLVANAVIHNPSGTQIYLRLKVLVQEHLTYPGLVFQVEDNGQGIDEETQNQLFNRYYRGTRTGSEKGTGLGMAIAKQLIEAHRGKIVVNSRPGEGTCIEVRLPPQS